MDCVKLCAFFITNNKLLPYDFFSQKIYIYIRNKCGIKLERKNSKVKRMRMKEENLFFRFFVLMFTERELNSE